MDDKQLQMMIEMSIGAGLGALSLRNRLRSIQEIDIGDSLESLGRIGRKILGKETVGEKVGGIVKKGVKGVLGKIEDNPAAAATGAGLAVGLPWAWRKTKATAANLRDRAGQIGSALTPGQ